MTLRYQQGHQFARERLLPPCSGAGLTGPPRPVDARVARSEPSPVVLYDWLRIACRQFWNVCVHALIVPFAASSLLFPEKRSPDSLLRAVKRLAAQFVLLRLPLHP